MYLCSFTTFSIFALLLHVCCFELFEHRSEMASRPLQHALKYPTPPPPPPLCRYPKHEDPRGAVGFGHFIRKETERQRAVHGPSVPQCVFVLRREPLRAYDQLQRLLRSTPQLMRSRRTAGREGPGRCIPMLQMQGHDPHKGLASPPTICKPCLRHAR